MALYCVCPRGTRSSTGAQIHSGLCHQPSVTELVVVLSALGMGKAATGQLLLTCTAHAPGLARAGLCHRVAEVFHAGRDRCQQTWERQGSHQNTLSQDCRELQG